jgi:integrative and conjugative element protein (TIGR02256 family)
MAGRKPSAARLPYLRGAVTTAPARIHRARLYESAAATILGEAVRSRDGYETGGILLGRLDADGTAEIRHAGDPGPVAVRRSNFFLRDLDHAQRLAERAFTRDGSVWVGDWHTHIAAAPVPSDRDLDTCARLLADPDLQFDAVVSIIVAGQGDWTEPGAAAWVCYPDHAEAVHLVVKQ